MATSSHVAAANRYARDVVSGKIVACKWARAACQRHLDDLERSKRDRSWPYRFDAPLAELRCRFVELLPHVKGAQWAGKRIELSPWQAFVICVVYGWVHRKTGLRRFRSVYLEVARKNAKTTMLAALCLAALTIDREPGAEVYSAATTRDQAKIVFGIARAMAQQEPKFCRQFGLGIFENSLVVDSTASRMMALSAEGSTLDGLNTHFAAIDELHAHKTRRVHDVLDSSLGSRSQPIMFKITTAGGDRAGVCYDERLYLTKLLNTVLKNHDGMGYKVEGNCADDDSYFGIIYSLDAGEEKDPFDESNWIKANPNLGVSVSVDDMRRMAQKARTQAAALGEFLTKRCNVWVGADSGWMNILAWDACADHNLREQDFAGERCWIGLDAGFKKDLFAKVKVFMRELPDGVHYYAFGRYYSHKALAEAEGNEHVAAWARDNWIRLSDGNVTDIADVREELIGNNVAAQPIAGDLQRFEIAEVAFDPAQIQQFASEMIEQGVPMVEVRPMVLHFSPPMKELDELITAKRFHHNGDPALSWMIANVVCHRDAKDNIYPRKERPENKIDGAIALIMAMSRALLSRPQMPSYYEQLAKAQAALMQGPDVPEASDDLRVEVENVAAAEPPPAVATVLSYWEQVAADRLKREREREAEQALD